MSAQLENTQPEIVTLLSSDGALRVAPAGATILIVDDIAANARSWSHQEPDLLQATAWESTPAS